MITRTFDNNSVPYFCWDRHLTAGEIRNQLRVAEGFEWVRLASWIMREASPQDVWQFLTPAQVDARFHELKPFLYRKADFWEYLLKTWHELGKI